MIVGILGLVNDLIVSLGAFNVVEMLVFLAAFLWFQNGYAERVRYFCEQDELAAGCFGSRRELFSCQDAHSHEGE